MDRYRAGDRTKVKRVAVHSWILVNRIAAAAGARDNVGVAALAAGEGIVAAVAGDGVVPGSGNDVLDAGVVRRQSQVQDAVGMVCCKVSDRSTVIG